MKSPAKTQSRRKPIPAPVGQQFKPTRRAGTSLHHQIFLVIRDRILSGNYHSGVSLPSEQELSEQFHVSRITVRAAMANLQASGLVERRQGVGTFVSARDAAPQLHTPVSDLLAHIADVNRSTQVKLLEMDFVTAPFHVQSQFNCQPQDLFQRAVRVRSTRELPVFHVTTYIPEPIARQFTRKEMGSTSLNQLLRAKGFQFKAGKQVVSAALADPSVANHLDVEVGAPLLQIRRLHFDEKGQPFEYMEMLASPARFELQMTLDESDLRG